MPLLSGLCRRSVPIFNLLPGKIAFTAGIFYFCVMQDSFLHRGKRRQLVEYLQKKIGIEDEAVLKAMNEVPRHLFLESAFLEAAYEDRAFPIAAQQTISHPSTVAEQSQLLQASGGMRVLEIGTGSGYQTAVLVKMGLEVYTVERQLSLFDFSGKKFDEINIHPCQRTFGDGFAGLAEFAPFDRILVTCGAEEMPSALLHQLKINGKIVIPLGKTGHQVLHRFTRLSEHEFEKETFGLYAFVPMLENISGKI